MSVVVFAGHDAEDVDERDLCDAEGDGDEERCHEDTVDE